MVEHVPQIIDTDYYNAGVFAPLLLPNRRTFAIVAAFTMSEARTGWKALLQVSPTWQLHLITLMLEMNARCSCGHLSTCMCQGGLGHTRGLLASWLCARTRTQQ